MLDEALDKIDVTRANSKDVVIEDRSKLIRQQLEIEADIEPSSYTASSVRKRQRRYTAFRRERMQRAAIVQPIPWHG
ncbi:hypothetical protein EV356DRAFT_553316 [Viridothelium virens]|uniref:Uncharacterized protein n=1 Tax=Viridothelium virens TaxID=1048519 RepID=A0A6A6GYT2_VIRVR|nr:hypothetical protein EV356DRAFT_553316 [Viridothelium virens]